MQNNYRIGFVSLGCPKALVDSERIITQLRAQGYELIGNYENAGLVIINTCGFIDSAVEESLSAIDEALLHNGKVIVTGCLGAKGNIVKERFPAVLNVSGPQAYEAVIEAVHHHLPPPKDPFQSLIPPQGIKLTPRHYAYLKISEGCNHKCSFCIIPTMRGKLLSRPISQVMQEATLLAKAGVKELLIISQDTSAYGIDTKYQTDSWQGQPIKTRFKELCTALGELGIWVRLHYVYPYPHVDDIIELMADRKIVPYLDIPFQHANPRILKIMKRPASSENNLTRLQKWREICPDITVRSTFIVGFPGETDQEFEELLAFLNEAQLDRVGCFEYSAVAGATANSLPSSVASEVKRERYNRLMQCQKEISQQKLRAKIGNTISVLIDAKEDNRFIARSFADAPEIDGLVYLEPHPDYRVGEFASVKVIAANEYDLFAKAE